MLYIECYYSVVFRTVFFWDGQTINLHQPQLSTFDVPLLSSDTVCKTLRSANVWFGDFSEVEVIDIFIILILLLQEHDNQTIMLLFSCFSLFFILCLLHVLQLYCSQWLKQFLIGGPCTVFCIAQGLPNKNWSPFETLRQPIIHILLQRKIRTLCRAVLPW